jgi:hypothetical protein
MQGIQPSALTDEEFLLHVTNAIDRAGSLPEEVVKELLYRAEKGGRDEEKRLATTNPKQLTLPFAE